MAAVRDQKIRDLAEEIKAQRRAAMAAIKAKATFQPLIPKGEPSGLLTHTATESVSLCEQVKS